MQEGNLHNWFSKSKSKDGKPGWVQSDGSPCANEPGETKSPKCYSSRRLAGLKKTKEGKKKIRSADARKSRQDPGQQQKSGASKPTMVRTFKDPKDYKKHPTGDHTPTKEEFEVQKETVIGEAGLAATYAAVKAASDHEKRSLDKSKTSAGAKYAMKKADERKHDGHSQDQHMTASQRSIARADKAKYDAAQERVKKAKMMNAPKGERQDAIRKYNIDKAAKISGDSNDRVKTEETVIEAKDKKGKGSGTKDDCYHKVKARYDVWPSAYASGALVKCRKKGAANWGNSPKNEEFLALPEMTDIQINAMRKAGIEVEVVNEDSRRTSNKQQTARVKANIKSFGSNYTPPNNYDPDANRGQGEVLTRKQIEKKRRKALRQEEVEEKSYTEKNRKTKMRPGSPIAQALKTDKKLMDLHKEDTEVEEGINLFKKPTPEQKAAKELKKRESLYKQYVRLKKQASDPHSDVNTSKQLVKKEEVELQEAGRIPAQTGNMFQVLFGWRGRMMMIKLFFPDTRYPSRQEVAQALNKIYPDSQLRSYSQSVVDYDDPYINVGVDEEVVKEESPAWQRKEGKSESGGLNQKGVESYRRANPGSKLKTAVTTKPSKLKKGSKSANRRKSFCARMSGMKKRLTSAKTANDPDSRINKSLRKWNC